MIHLKRTPLIMMAALAAAVAGAVWAADDQGQSSYQAAPSSPSPSGSQGNIIGYQPISNEALDAAMPAPSHAVSAYPGTPQTPGLSGQGQVGSQAGVPSGSSSQLPSAYLTGILGDGPYTLGRDDVLHIDVRNQPEFTGDFIIGFDGRIQYNYLGDIPIAGLTKYEVQQVLEKLLDKYVRVPAVTVTIVQYNSKVVYVIGEVGRPGKFIMRGDAIKLREAILAAGLPTRDAALGRVHVIKPDLNAPSVRVINLKRILYKGKLQDDVDLYPGEIVVVPSTVLSSVNRFLSSLLNPLTRAASSAALSAL